MVYTKKGIVKFGGYPRPSTFFNRIHNSQNTVNLIYRGYPQIKTYRYSPCVLVLCRTIIKKIVMLNRFITKQWKSSKSGINIHNFNLMQYQKYAMSCSSHIFFFYSKKVDILIPDFDICFVLLRTGSA